MMFRRLSALLAALVLTPFLHAQPSAGGKPTGQEILRLTQQFLSAAPRRAIGTPGHAAAEAFIKSHFAPEAAKHDFITDTFYASTPAGQMPMTNFIVKYPGKKDGIIVLASHYETNYPLKDINFQGANDGGCTTALLIALGEYFRTHPPQGYSIWILLDDGEEAVGKDGMSASDSLYGVRHIAAKWSADGTIGKIKAFLLADMLGWKDMNIDKEDNSTPWLTDLLATAARNTGHSNFIFKHEMTIEDDHLAFKQRGVPVLDLICYEYGPFDSRRGDYAFHHTVEDSLDKLSPASLQASSDIFLELIHLINMR